MSESFFDRVHKNDTLHSPDVLSCLANLSNDEVFTPPEVVNQMLDMLPQDLFSDPSTKFLDPACKTGVFLREIAKRLLVGLETLIPNLEERIEHIYKNQLYGIAITELTSLLSRRSLYCSKYPNGEYSICRFDNPEGNIRFKKIQHTWDKGKCKYCGASKAEYNRELDKETHAYEFIHHDNFEEIMKMRFDVIISNPPYQLSDGGGTGSSAVPIYHYFILQSIKLSPRYMTMIIPSRWFAGGKGLDDFRQYMLNCNHISNLIDFADSSDCFPGVNVAGGVNYFLWERDYNGECVVFNKKNNETISKEKRLLSENNVFVRDNRAIEIIRKVQSKKEATFDNIVYSRNCFNLFSKELGHSNKNHNDLVLWSLKGKSYIDKNKIQDRNDLVNKYKVMITKAMSGGNKPSSEGSYQVVSSLKVLKPNEICTETYLCMGSFKEKEKAIHLRDYISTKFFRFLLLQSLTSINISKEKFQFIPLLDFSVKWTDKKLYQKYLLSEEEVSYVESVIKELSTED